ncbi:putative acyl-activating enzyme 19 [Phytophthora ramorum]|uniref:putative acyl-activating enzyme 19 n=1 Tax=Phytophthora ramorum TaxID=164328 RepID=UPI0030A9A028|nr:putative acyl-activating enzyme 19 [Phytophthora ramorum]
MTMLCQCLGELWTARDEELAMIQSVGGKWRQEVSYANVWQWIQEVREAVDGEEDEWLVVGINVAPFSIEETASMLMVAQQRHWSYVPVDVQLPVAKQRSILTNARVQRLVTIPESPLAKFLSTEEKRTVELPSSPFRSVQVLRFTDGYFQSKGEKSVRRFQAKADGDVAPLYMLFTSGTTGEPRGVLGTRVGAWTRLQWMWEMYPFTRSSERVLRATKLSFVDSVWEILGAFLQGVPLVHLQRPRQRHGGADCISLNSVVLDDSAQFLAVVQSEHVTRFTAVPSVLEVLLLQMREIDRRSALSKLRYVLSSGESLPLQVLRQLWATLPEATILNLYGSTEVSGDVTCMELRAPASAVEAVEWQQHGVPIAKLDPRGIVGQELLHMTIGAMLSNVGSPLDKRFREETTVKALPRFINSRNDTAKVDRDRDLSFGNELKRRKMARRAQSDGLADGDGNEHGDTSQRDKLNFVSRYNQSSMSINGIYTPTCYISPPPTQQTAPTPSLSWELRTAWKVDLEKCIDASPLVVQRLDAKDVICSSWAIVGSHSAQLVCVDLEDAGKEIWRVQLDDRIEACAALSVKHEIVYVGTYAGTLFALDLCLGDTRWLFHAKGIIKASAVAIDKYGVVVCGSYDNSLYGLDAVTGKLRWFLDLQGSIFSTPLYCAWSGQLFAASTNGKVVAVKSEVDDFGSIMEQWKLELPAPVFAGLNADYDSKKLIVGCADGKLYGVDMTAGAIQWQLSTEKPIFSSPCVYHPGVVVFGSHDGRLRKVDCHSGQLVWTTNLHGAVFASPTVVRLVETPFDRQPRHNFTVAEEEGSLVCCVTTTTGQLYFCDEETGSIIYQSGNSSGKVLLGANSCESSGDLGPLFGSPVLVDNWCLLGTRTNDFFGFEFTGCSPGLSRVRPYSGKSGGSAT